MLVVAPITAEFEALAGAFDERWGSPVLRDTGRVPVREYTTPGVVLAEGGFGKVQYGVTTQHLLDHLSDVDLVVCAGVAGALTESAQVGDVVVGTATHEHDFYSEVLSRVPPRECLRGSMDPVSTSRASPGPWRGSCPLGCTSPRLRAVTRASPTASRREEIHDRTDALAVAFEGAGGARAALFSGVPFLEVRGISDMADGDILEAIAANLPDTMANVAAVVARLAAP